MRRPSTEACDVLVLGGGLAGLATARALGLRATVLECDQRPGGVARSQRQGEYHFDHTIHLLYFPDSAVQERVMALADHHLAECPAEAWVESAAGTTRFPFQLHLGRLEREARERCVRDFEIARAAANGTPATDFETLLRESFGAAMCDLFFLPYNRKMWKRPLAGLAPSGFQWNITVPTIEQVRASAASDTAEFKSYNASGWYPRPPGGAAVRGIEVVVRSMARGTDVRLGHIVTQIDLEKRMVMAEHAGEKRRYHYGTACCPTLPLPQLINACVGVPEPLRWACRRLRRNRVRSIALCIQGPRPEGTGLWRYFTDETVVFTRLIYPHRFDPLAAPPDGWILLAEITEPGEETPESDKRLFARVIADARRTQSLSASDRIVSVHGVTIDPAYVVFRPGEREIVEAARSFLESRDVYPVGRYGRWEYSSMGQVMRDGFALGDKLAGVQSTEAPARKVTKAAAKPATMKQHV